MATPTWPRPHTMTWSRFCSAINSFRNSMARPEVIKSVRSEAIIPINIMPANIRAIPYSFSHVGACSRLKSPKPTVVTIDVVK